MFNLHKPTKSVLGGCWGCCGFSKPALLTTRFERLVSGMKLGPAVARCFKSVGKQNPCSL